MAEGWTATSPCTASHRHPAPMSIHHPATALRPTTQATATWPSASWSMTALMQRQIPALRIRARPCCYTTSLRYSGNTVQALVDPIFLNNYIDRTLISIQNPNHPSFNDPSSIVSAAATTDGALLDLNSTEFVDPILAGNMPVLLERTYSSEQRTLWHEIAHNLGLLHPGDPDNTITNNDTENLLL